MKKYLFEEKNLMEEWVFEKNDELGLDPQKITIGSEKKAYWKCKICNTIYFSSIGHRARGKGCPVCGYLKRSKNRIKTLVQKNGSFAQKHPELLIEWDTRNEIIPEEITERSNKIVGWVCKNCGFAWKTSPNERVRGRGCPKCSYQKIGVNEKKTKLAKSGSLKIINPLLAEEWDISNDYLSSQISPKSHYNALWVCHSCGNKWRAPVYARQIGSGCPKCSDVKKYSIPEKLISYFLNNHFELIENYKPEFLYPKEVDIFIPALNLAIEYDGERFHKDVSKDKHKNDILFQNGITLIRIREPKCPVFNYGITFVLKKERDYYSMLQFIYDYLNLGKALNKQMIDEALIHVSSEMLKRKKDNSIANKYPSLLSEWDYEKNGDLLPEYVQCGSNLVVNWICPKNHKYKMMVSKRTLGGRGCMYCNGGIKKPIAMVDIEGNILEKYDSIADAARKSNYTEHVISNRLKSEKVVDSIRFIYLSKE